MDVLVGLVGVIVVVAALGIIPALVLLFIRDRIRKHRNPRENPSPVVERTPAEEEASAGESSPQKSGQLLLTAGSFFCAWMAARLITNGWITFLLWFVIFLVIAAIALAGSMKQINPRVGKRRVIVAAGMLVLLNLFTGNEPYAPPQKETPTATPQKVLDASTPVHDIKPVSSQGPIIVRKYGTIGLGDSEQVARSKLEQAGISLSSIIANQDIPTLIIGQDQGRAYREISIPSPVTTGSKITAITIGSGVLILVFRDDKLFYIDTSFDAREPTAGRMMEMSEAAYKSLLRNASDTGGTIGSVWRKGWVKYYSDRTTGLLLFAEIGAIGSSGAGSVPNRIHARLVLYDVSIAKSL